MGTLETIKEAVLGPYEVRKTWAQKGEFMCWARDYAARYGLTMRAEESGKIVRTRNLVFGDVERANVLITAHYDTCARLPFPNMLTPACWPVILLTQLILPALLFGVAGFAAGALAGGSLAALGVPVEAVVPVTSLASAALCFLVVYLMLFGPANPHTANDNTSGVAFVLLAMEALAGRQDVAFVLFDNEEKGLFGSSAFLKRHPDLSKRVLVLNADCVSDGDTLMLVGSRAATRAPLWARLADALDRAARSAGKRAMTGVSPRVLYPSDQMVFPKGMGLAALRGKRILYMDRIHTARDTVFEDANLLCLLEAVTGALG